MRKQQNIIHVSNPRDIGLGAPVIEKMKIEVGKMLAGEVSNRKTFSDVVATMYEQSFQDVLYLGIFDKGRNTLPKWGMGKGFEVVLDIQFGKIGEFTTIGVGLLYGTAIALSFLAGKAVGKIELCEYGF